MPYIAIKAFPKDEETKKKIVEKINEAFLEIWGCPAQAITISMEEVDPAEWEEKIVQPEIALHLDRMMILSGEKQY